MIKLPNYSEYQSLLNKFTREELQEAYAAMTSPSKQELLHETNPCLSCFFVDSSLQEKLFLYFEDLRQAKNKTGA